MEDRNLFQMLGQVSGGEAAQVFRDHLRGFVRKLICDVMASEGKSTSFVDRSTSRMTERYLVSFNLVSFKQSIALKQKNA